MRRRNKDIRVGDLVALYDEIKKEIGPIGIVLKEIEVSEEDSMLYRDIVEKNKKKRKNKRWKEYQCLMVGKSGATIIMVFSENNLVVLARANEDS